MVALEQWDSGGMLSLLLPPGHASDLSIGDESIAGGLHVADLPAPSTTGQQRVARQLDAAADVPSRPDLTIAISERMSLMVTTRTTSASKTYATMSMPSRAHPIGFSN